MDSTQQELSLESYRDDQLWGVVVQRMAWPQRERLRELTSRGKQGDLTDFEQAELDNLLDRVDSFTLRRSHALSLLKQRGYSLDHYFRSGMV